MEHVAIVAREYAEAILAGRKTIEARLSLTRRAPFGRVRAGDVVYVKETGGPFRARCIAARVEVLEGLDETGVARLARRYRAPVGAPASFWRSRGHARYATLVWLASVRACDRGPDYQRRPGYCARNAWHVLSDQRRASAPRSPSAPSRARRRAA